MEDIENGYKKCKLCESIKPLTEEYFRWQNKKLKTFRAQCKQCGIKYDKQYRAGNKNEIKNRQQTYYKNNRDKILEEARVFANSKEGKIYRSGYRKRNRDKINARARVYDRAYIKKDHVKENIAKRNNAKYKQDPNFKLRRLVSGQINCFLKRNNSTKNNKSIVNVLDYSFKELKAHLESLFEPWMTWNNHGRYIAKTWDDNDSLTWTWNIDHVVPQSDLPYDSLDHYNFKKCWGLKNLRPYSAKQNIVEGALKTRHDKKE